jgi:hypothetical protein
VRAVLAWVSEERPKEAMSVLAEWVAQATARLCSVPDPWRSVAAHPVNKVEEGLARLAPADVLGQDARG